MRSVIVSCAIAGSPHTPSMSPRLPTTLAEIAEAVAAAAGAAILHLHVRDPSNGRPVATQNALFGGNSWVGLEDSLLLERGPLARSNADRSPRSSTSSPSSG